MSVLAKHIINRCVQEKEQETAKKNQKIMRHLTGIEVKFVRRLAIAPSNVAYSSVRTIAIILSSSVSLLWLLKDVELDEALSFGCLCVILGLEVPMKNNDNIRKGC
jgi:hypothetical protein